VRDGDWLLIHWLLSQPSVVVEQTNRNQESAFSIAFYSGRFNLVWLLVKKSPVYWCRFLMGSAIAATLLIGGAGALLFFFYSITLPALICFGLAALCLLLAAYQFFASPTARPSSSQPSLPSLSQRIHGSLPSAAVAPAYSSAHTAHIGLRSGGAAPLRSHSLAARLSAV